MASSRTKKEAVYSHERLNFPVAGSADPRVALPDIDLFSQIPIQDSVESVQWDFFYPESGNLLPTSPRVQFKAKESQYMSDLSDTYLMFELSFNKSGDDPAIDPAEQTCPTNFMSAVIFKVSANANANANAKKCLKGVKKVFKRTKKSFIGL